MALRAAILLFCIPAFVAAQRPAASIPFIGCKSDGQTGAIDAPKGTGKSVSIGQKTAQMLAYYSADGAAGSGILAPRGWYCFGTYGSGGASLVVSPRPIDEANVFSPDWSAYTGPAIIVDYSFGETSGRLGVADIIARVFPAYKSFATMVGKEFDPDPSPFTFGPFPNDTLHYRNNRVVEYKTPAQTKGLGTHSGLKKNDSPIEGAAVLTAVARMPDATLLSIRLPATLTALTPTIVSQFEQETLHPNPR